MADQNRTSPDFAVVLRGYDRIQVDAYIAKLAERMTEARSRVEAAEDRIAHVERFIDTAERRGLALPGVYGIFFYRSANRRTLDALQSFVPVPVEELIAEFGAGATAEEICARSIRAAMEVGAKHFYISNLPVGRAQSVLGRILEKVG